MAIRIRRQSSTPRVKRLIDKISDHKNGVSVLTEKLGGKILYEGTPLTESENGFFEVVKTAGLVTKAVVSATDYVVGKEHHFQIGNMIAIEGGKVGSKITAIDRKDVAGDKLTVEATLGAGAVGAVIYESDASGKSVAMPTMLTGDDKEVGADDTIWTNAWYICQAKRSICAPVTKDMEVTLKGVIYNRVK